MLLLLMLLLVLLPQRLLMCSQLLALPNRTKCILLPRPPYDTEQHFELHQHTQMDNGTIHTENPKALIYMVKRQIQQHG
jgi:hypothetical protein